LLNPKDCSRAEKLGLGNRLGFRVASPKQGRVNSGTLLKIRRVTIESDECAALTWGGGVEYLPVLRSNKAREP